MDQRRATQRHFFHTHIKHARTQAVEARRADGLVNQQLFEDDLPSKLTLDVLSALHTICITRNKLSCLLQNQLCCHCYVQQMVALLVETPDEDVRFDLLDCLAILVYTDPRHAEVFVYQTAGLPWLLHMLHQWQHVAFRVLWLLAVLLADDDWHIATAVWHQVWPALHKWQPVTVSEHAAVVFVVRSFWCDKDTVFPDSLLSQAVPEYLMAQMVPFAMTAPVDTVGMVHHMLDIFVAGLTATEALPLYILKYSAVWKFDPALLCRCFGLLQKFPAALRPELFSAVMDCTHAWQVTPALLDDTSLTHFLNFFLQGVGPETRRQFGQLLLPTVAQEFSRVSLALQSIIARIMAHNINGVSDQDWVQWLLTTCDVLAILLHVLARTFRHLPANYMRELLLAVNCLLPYLQPDDRRHVKKTIYLPVTHIYNTALERDLLKISGKVLDALDAKILETML